VSDKPIVLVGAGGHARSVENVMRTKPVRLVAAGEDESYIADYQGENVVITVGCVGEGAPETSIRRKVIDRYTKGGVTFGSIVADNASIAGDVVLGEGSVVLQRAVVNAGAKIGRHAVINTGVIIEHDVVLGENVNIAPGAIVLGGASIGDNSFIGAGAIVRQGAQVAANVIVGMGAMVTKDIVESGTYVGSPARRIG